jgi:hypothetical protein
MRSRRTPPHQKAAHPQEGGSRRQRGATSPQRRAIVPDVTPAATLVALACLATSQGNVRAATIAAHSPVVTAAVKDIDARVAEIKDPAIHAAVIDLLAHPAPTFLRRFPDAPARDAVLHQLQAADLVDATVTAHDLFPPAPGAAFAAAPGNPPGHHHAHPGGLAEHTDFNLTSALALERQYRAAYGVDGIDHDVIIAAAVLHDVFKAWCLQWQDDGTTIAQPQLAGTAAHHPLMLAEALYRKLPTRLVLALAAAHDTNPVVVRGWLRAAQILAGTDAPAVPDAPTFEMAINHLADHDFVLADPAGARVDLALLALADKNHVPASERRWWVNEKLARVPPLRVYDAWLRGGDAAVAEVMQ